MSSVSCGRQVPQCREEGLSESVAEEGCVRLVVNVASVALGGFFLEAIASQSCAKSLGTCRGPLKGEGRAMIT